MLASKGGTRQRKVQPHQILSIEHQCDTITLPITSQKVHGPNLLKYLKQANTHKSKCTAMELVLLFGIEFGWS